MLDIELIRNEPEKIKKEIARKGVGPELIDEVILIDRNRRRVLSELERAQSELNRHSKDIAKLHGQQKIDAINEASTWSTKVKDLKPEADQTQKEFLEIMLKVPNPPLPDVIDGESDKDNKPNRKVGEPTRFSFKSLDHVALGEKLDLIDIERAGKISGSRFYFLKNELVQLEFALVQYALEILVDAGFSPMIPPILLNRETMVGAGYLPAGEDEIYRTQDDLFLAGTSEQPLAGYHAGEIIDEKKLPFRYAGFSSCFRREAGSHGKDVRGILRGHQFDKVEMFSYTTPKDSEKEHEFLVSLEEKIVSGLGLPYQIIDICTGELGAPAAKKYDLETWMPGENNYRETHSCSNCTDFQARRLNIRFRNKAGKVEILHTLNGTAIAIGRTLIAIMENYQQKNGSIKVPEVLLKWLPFKEIKRK
ncbi:MAG: seryl-tRNA synthetase [Candidatus Berkelbacteria bacterium Athens1014_28]|uniref:Serine--tRNA ligase n=1 Tax=Candidatus Berkelbacteria bacterium Athens1014_28 TaxID=2017145 RepID=A0A554LPZ6_9BACT|nr:MAG: seryl-tRNA synthetase [Candidatus Berkelbacteria bacterium Athens1014_28]